MTDARLARVSNRALTRLGITDVSMAQMSLRALVALIAAGVNAKTWNGTAYVDSPIKTWNGTAYVDALGVKTYNGTSFV